MDAAIRLYLISFIGCSLFGFLQLLFGVFGYSLLVEQWWIEGRLPRLNGFSYEPSYYSTYLLIGFSLSYYLYRSNLDRYGKLPFYTCACSFLAIFLSSSRMGILVVAIQLLIYELIFNRKRIKQLSLFIIAFFSITAGAFIYIAQNENLAFLLAGLGIMGGSAHSSLERLDGFMTQVDILAKNPLKGYSLGGVSQAIAFEKGVTTISQETIKPYDISMNIFLEVLTASGAIGFLFFVYYIYSTTVKVKRRINVRNTNTNDCTLINALVWSLLFEFLILCFNQNVLRAYLWVHIGLLNGVYFCIRNEVVPSINNKKG
ncbi:O-antigen ligase family protein [Rudanella lutea]|uniref:O-antigen ligase family protein n=1 Tax=Rudanella lutea TaxID=451374 RepID=UPI001B7FC635|nr:O-antigen ligase family protein [Rudanella lutea]